MVDKHKGGLYDTQGMFSVLAEHIVVKTYEVRSQVLCQVKAGYNET